MITCHWCHEPAEAYFLKDGEWICAECRDYWRPEKPKWFVLPVVWGKRFLIKIIGWC